MNVYGTLTGTLTSAGTVTGTLSSALALSATLTIPNAAGVNVYDGAYEVVPKAYEEQTLLTEGKIMANDVTVFKVPYYETSNIFDGLTVFIAEDTNG